MPTRLGSNFDRMSIAAGVSNLGDGMFAAALPLLVASLTRDPGLVAGATLAGRAPWFLFAVLSGTLVDIFDRRRVMIISNLVRGLGMGILAWSVAAGSVDLVVVYAIAFGLGVAETFFDTSAEALVPQLVSTDRLPSANARLQGLEFVGNSFAGPPLGALLFAAVAAAPLLISAGSFWLAAGCVALIGGLYQSDREISDGVGRDIVAGLVWLWRQRVVRTLSLLAGAINLFVFSVVAVFVLYAQDILGVGEAGYGILLAMLGVGGLSGAILAPRVIAALGPGTTLRMTLTLQMLGVAAFTLLNDPVPAGALLIMFGALTSAWNVVAVSQRQRLTPDRLRGRVAGAARMLAWGSQPLGAVVGGVVASRYGLRAPFVFAASGYLFAIAASWRIISNTSMMERGEKGPA